MDRDMKNNISMTSVHNLKIYNQKREIEGEKYPSKQYLFMEVSAF